jgi:Flp pilus assembly protein CpaB
MSKRLVIKTVLICVGLFLIINSVLFVYVFKKYPLDTEKHISVIVAAADISEGTIIQERWLKTKEIRQSALTDSMITQISEITGKKAKLDLNKNDYIISDYLVDRADWYKDDERIIVLPVSIEERLANLIVKGSYVDINLQKETGDLVEPVLSKVKVQDLLDDKGTPINSKSGVNSKTAYIKLILDKGERQKIYSAKRTGKLIYELYCDETQKSVMEAKEWDK